MNQPLNQPEQMPALPEEASDRILDAYEGRMGEEFKQLTRSRIHWVCSKVSGHAILDVGCSQGLVPVLLGRAGKVATGIDLSAAAIAVAQNFLAGETAEVKSRVTFFCGDFLDQEAYSGKEFDTIIMAEVLEHLHHPEIFIERASQYLKPGGRLIITVPFGINDYIDHKHTFYAFEPLRLISPDFDVDDFEVFGKWIGFSAHKRTESIAAGLIDWPWPLLEKMEKAFQENERSLIDEAAELQRRLADANLKYRLAGEQLADLKSRQENRSSREIELSELQTRLRAAQIDRQQFRQLQEEVKALRQTGEENSLRLQKAAADAEETAQTLTYALNRHSDLKRKVRELEVELETSRAAAEEEKQRREQIEAGLTLFRNRPLPPFASLRDSANTAAGTEESTPFGALENTLSVLETTRALRRDEQLQHEVLKQRALRAGKALNDACLRIEKLQQKLADAEARITRTRETLSFQLGYLLIHGFKSLSDFCALPKKLASLRREAVHRRREKESREILFARTAAAIRSVSGFPLPAAPAAATSCWLPGVLAGFSDEVSFAEALQRLKVACIMDEFTDSAFRPECNLLALTPGHWERELTEFVPELLFVESAWRGKDDLWAKKVNHLSTEVLGIVAWCRERQIPTVFWNKEDPVHFETFLNAAKLFDYVFTTDIDCIHRYKAALGHDRVYLLPFACQPAVNNPIELYERKAALCFAGAYYARYPERNRDLAGLIDALCLEFPVEIYDRNFGKNDPNYQFPPEYQPFIVGHLPFDEIDKAYKGYSYAINLNSIKQSQSMFARRVFELLASNTVTVSNFSRGIRLFFGDLVINTDSGEEALRRLEQFGNDEVALQKFRLAGLRKVMREHTYQDRLSYVVARAQMRQNPRLLPGIVVIAYVKNADQLARVLSGFDAQLYPHRQLILVVPEGENLIAPDREDLQVIASGAAASLRLLELTGSGDWVCGFVPDDYYGPNYLVDLALATRYSSAAAIGKIAHYVWSSRNGLNLCDGGKQYLPGDEIAARSALLQRRVVEDHYLLEWATSLYSRRISDCPILGIDQFNYCQNGNAPDFLEHFCHEVDDLAGLDSGIAAREILARSERIAPAEESDESVPTLGAATFAALFKPTARADCRFSLADDGWHIDSTLGEGRHDYFYAAVEQELENLGYVDRAEFYFDVTPGLNLQLVLFFLDRNRQKISHVIRSANRNHVVDIPPGTAAIRFGLRIYSSGSATVRGLALGHRPLRLKEVIGRGEYLLLTNQYPSYDDLYRNAFVHSRVAGYRRHGLAVDVFRLRPGEEISFSEFHDVDVLTGSQESLFNLLADGAYKSILVHFLDEAMWQVLQHFADRVKIFVWVHGAEIQPWQRRPFHYEGGELDAAKRQSEARLDFWKRLLLNPPENLHLIFVSRYLAETVQEDLGFSLPEHLYSIIHNPIDTETFEYQSKHAEQRKRILSIRPFASKTYANDLTVQAILALRDKPYFAELEFRIIGDGRLFDEVIRPLRDLKNVCIERRFLTQEEIAGLHAEHGVFLCPSRMDTQGVSRDEAMASGLVPVTNAVAAIPEFVDDESGLLAAAEDADGLAAAIARLYEDPACFFALSQAAAERVRRQRGATQMISREISLFSAKSDAAALPVPENES